MTRDVFLLCLYTICFITILTVIILVYDMFLSVVQLCLEAEGRFIQYILVVYVILRYDSQFSTGDM